MSQSVEEVPEKAEKAEKRIRGGPRMAFYIIILIISLSLMNFVFGEAPFTAIPDFLQPYSGALDLLRPFLIYARAALVFFFGYQVLNAVGVIVYTYMLRVSDRPTAAAIRSLTKISGIAVLLGLVGSLFGVSPAAALTMGSFGGMVVGFASQTIMTHVIAGVFLLITRPFSYGETVTVAGQTGTVKEIRLMHLVLDTGKEEILIPSGTVVTQILKKKKISGSRED
jgi:small-conductance mechanosensitive channel